MPQTTIHVGDALRSLRSMPDASVHCVVTSTPYYGLRDYGTATWAGGDPDCAHVAVGTSRTPWANSVPGPNGLAGKNAGGRNTTKETGGHCAVCGAVREDAQIGLEPTPAEFVAALVAVFVEVWRVLRDDGTLWLNLGDSYATGGGKANSPGGGEQGKRFTERAGFGAARGGHEGKHAGAGVPVTQPNRMPLPGLKSKDLIGIPWRVAFALQEAGWYLRSEVIWAKPSPMPESVTDRPTRAHETVFLLTKQPRYFYDAFAIAEPAAQSSAARAYLAKRPVSKRHVEMQEAGIHGKSDTLRVYNRETRNARTVWTISSKPFSGAHFATMPPTLAERCIMAGTSAAGCCPSCGVAYRRQTEKLKGEPDAFNGSRFDTGKTGQTQRRNGDTPRTVSTRTTGWAAGCRCEAGPAAPCTVLDPFAGVGTTALVASRLGRDAVLCELSPEYAEAARRRISAD
ncbi:MAG TPA: site-specific DNA-methyltransferase, partial [Rubricoccaceae bacterium]